MRATIMIPAFNAERFVSEAIESALDQSFKGPYEVVVVNDGSTDKTGMIIDEYAKRFARMARVVHRQQNGGVGVARNAVLENARGDVLLGLDADDRLERRALERVVGEFEEHPSAGFVYSDQREIDERGNEIRVRRRWECDRHFDSLIYHCLFAGHVMSFRRRQLAGARFDPSLRSAGDWEFLLKVLPRTGHQHIPETLYAYRINHSGISFTRGRQVAQDSLRVLEKHLGGRYQGTVEIAPVNAGNNTVYYDHLVDGVSVMSESVRSVLLRYLRNEN